MSAITVTFPAFQNVHNYRGTVTLRVWYTGCVGPNFIASDNVTTVMCGSGGGNWYVDIPVTIVGTQLSIPATALESTDDSNTSNVLASAQFYVNGAAKDFLFQYWIITNTLGAAVNFSSLWIYNEQVTPSATMAPAYLTAPQVAALILSSIGNAKANVSPLVDPINGRYGIVALSAAPTVASDPIARSMSDITNPFLINRTGVPAVTGATAQGLDIKLTGNEDVLNFGGLMGVRVQTTWNGTGSVNHQTLQPLAVYGQHTGTGRIDSAIASTAAISNTGGGHLEVPRVFSGAIQNTGSSTMGGGSVYFADWFQSGTAGVSGYSALYEGRFRNFSGTPTTPAVYGLYFTGWTKAGGSTVTESAAIRIDNSVDIGTTKRAIYSTSLSDSVLYGGLTLGTAGLAHGQLRFGGSASGTVTIQPKPAAGTWSLTLPDTAGTSGFVLQTDGTGITSWVAQSGGGGSSPGGANTQMQYNAAGVLGGISGATTNGTFVTLTAPVLVDPITILGIGIVDGLLFRNAFDGSIIIDSTAYVDLDTALTSLANAMVGDVTGVYNAIGPTFTTTIGTGKVTNSMLAGGISEDKLVGTDIFRLGTITTGVWNAGNVTANGFLFANAATANVFLKDTATGFQSATTLIVTPQANNSLRSTNFTSGLVGWGINAVGDAEFANVDVRGAIHASVITYNAILATSGTLGVFKAAAKLLNDVVITAGPTYGTTTFNIDVEDQEGLTHAASQLFVVNDILRLKDGLTGDTWFKVTVASDQTTFWRYTASIQAGTNTVTYRAGLGVADYGQAGAGFIILTADQTNSPYEQMATHAATFTAASSAGTLILTPQLRLGNLNGSYGYASEIYGFAAGQYGAPSKSWITVDQTNGIRIGNNTTQLAQWNISGDILVGQQSAGQSNTFINAGAFSIRNNVTSLFNVNTAGSLRIGTDTAVAATTNLFVSNQSATYNSESFAIGDILIGDNTAASNFGNIKITAGTIRIRRGTTDYVTLDSTNVQLTNKLILSGASSAFAIGTTPPTSASAGTGLWIDRTGIYALLSGVSNVVLNSGGLTIKSSSISAGSPVFNAVNAYMNVRPDTGAPLSTWYDAFDAAELGHYTSLTSESITGQSSIFLIKALAPAGSVASITLSTAIAGVQKSSVGLGNLDVTITAGGSAQFRVINNNYGFATNAFGTSAANVLSIANGTAPSTSPAGVGQLYVEAGALKYRGSAGTVTTLGVA